MGRSSHRKRLNLWMNDDYVGYWESSSRGDVLVYDESWVNSTTGRPISLSLPFTPDNQPLRGSHVGAYFDNLLPDNELIKKRIATRFKANSISAFDLLSQVGKDCVGALRLIESDIKPDTVKQIQADALDDSQVASILRNSTEQRLIQDDEELRLSLAGAQEKTALLQLNGRWYKPIGNTPTTHILKLPLGLIGAQKVDFKYSVEIEWLCLKLMNTLDIKTAEADIVQFEDQKVLSVKRFDRRLSTNKSWIIRLPQEDMCQALGLYSLYKYESDGGPEISEIMSILDHSRYAFADKLTFYKTQLLFWLLWAPDGHAKNFSLFIHPQGDYQLTPIYDVISAISLIGRGPNKINIHKLKMAMSIKSKNKHWYMLNIQKTHWIHLAKEYGIEFAAGKQIDEIFEEIRNSVYVAIEQISNALPKGFPNEVADAIFNQLKKNVQLIK